MTSRRECTPVASIYWSFWDNRGTKDAFDTMLIKFPSKDVNEPSYAGYPTMTKYPARQAYDVYRCYLRSIAVDSPARTECERDVL